MKNFILKTAVTFVCFSGLTALQAQDIYVACQVGNYAKVFKNGQELYTLNNGNYSCLGMALAISGSDVWTCVNEGTSNGGISTKVYKNGQLNHILSSTISLCVSMAVAGDDVYICGTEYILTANQAVVYKNGAVLYSLTDGTRNGYAERIVLHGSDIYVSGNEANANKVKVAKVWKNGQEWYALSNGQQHAQASGLYVDGGDIYACGSEENANKIEVAKVWKNGNELYTLTGGQYDSYAACVAVSGSDVFSCGYNGKASGMSAGLIWKNNQEWYVLNGATTAANVVDIELLGSDIYTCGYELGTDAQTNDILYYPKVWKNDKELYSMGSASIQSVAAAWDLAIVANSDVKPGIASRELQVSVTGNSLTVTGVDAKAKASIVSLQGKEMLQTALTGGSIDISSLPAGVYILKVGDSATKFIKK
jgi:hypothetical protein